MNAPLPPIGRSISRLEAGCWAVALLLVSAVWAAGSTLILQAPMASAGMAAPEPAIMIELAEMPVAVDTDSTEIADDRQDSPAADAPSDPETADPPRAEASSTPPRPAPPVPVAPVAVAEADPVLPVQPALVAPRAPEPLHHEVRTLAALETPTIPVPLTKPKPPAEKKWIIKTAVTRTPSLSARKARAKVTQSTRTAARETTVSTPETSQSQMQSWKARVAAKLERRKRYPASSRARGEQGTALVSFRIDAGGAVLSSRLLRSSGFTALDEAALRMVAQASPVPAPPPGASKTITAPVQFRN